MRADLRKHCPPIIFQGDSKSCYAQAAVFGYSLIRRQFHNDDRQFSAQYVYYNARLNRGAADLDGPTTADDTMQAMLSYGVCEEKDFPYSVDDYAESPAPQIYINASGNKITDVKKLTSLMDIRDTLDEGYPVIFNYLQHSSQFTEGVEATGVIPKPLSGDYAVSSHAVCAVGYDIHKQHVIFANSFGDRWGDAGYGYLHFDTVRDPKLANHFRTFKG